MSFGVKRVKGCLRAVKSLYVVFAQAIYVYHSKPTQSSQRIDNSLPKNFIFAHFDDICVFVIIFGKNYISGSQIL